MSVHLLTDSPLHAKDGGAGASERKGNPDTIEQLLGSARSWAHTTAWVVYRAGEQLHLLGQGDLQAQ